MLPDHRWVIVYTRTAMYLVSHELRWNVTGKRYDNSAVRCNEVVYT